MAEIRNILLIRIRAFGDTLLTTPTLRGLKQAYPGARLSVVLEPAMGEILKGLPYVDEIIPYDRLGMKKLGWWGELKANLRFNLWLRSRRFDLVLDVLGTPRTAWMTLFSGAPRRVGFAFRVRRLAYNTVWHPAREPKYIADFTADVLRALGHQPDSLDLDFDVPGEARARADEFLRAQGLEGRRVVMASPAGGWELKRYPAAQLGRALDLIQKRSDARVLLLWGPGERELAEEVAAGMDPAPLLAPPTDLRLLAAFLQRAALLVTNDGANKHLAVATRTPTLTLFGPTSDLAWHPPADPRHRALKLALPCMPCEKLACRWGGLDKALPAGDPGRRAGVLLPQDCLRLLEPEKVAQAALEMLERP